MEITAAMKNAVLQWLCANMPEGQPYQHEKDSTLLRHVNNNRDFLNHILEEFQEKGYIKDLMPVRDAVIATLCTKAKNHLKQGGFK